LEVKVLINQKTLLTNVTAIARDFEKAHLSVTQSLQLNLKGL